MSDHEHCKNMGEEFFHPQMGLHMEGHDGFLREATDLEEQKAKENKRETRKYLNSREVNLVTCDKNYYFDMFCGKARQAGFGKPAGFEIWIDTSSSLRGVDFASKGQSCHRKSFAKALRGSCKNKVDIYSFDTSRKLVSSLDSLCTTYGLNDSKRLVKWITDSMAKNLIIVTDISEFTVSLTDDLRALGVRYRGHEVKSPIYASQLMDMLGSVKKFCR